MAWYDTGTVSVTNGSTTVTGSGTNFISGAQIGEAFYGPDDNLHEIQAIVSATVITLADAYLGSTQTGQQYKIVPTQSLVADLTTQVSSLISDFQSVKDEAGEGKFDDGTAASAGITFNLDQDTGFFRPAANQIGFTTAGVRRTLLSNTAFQVDVPLTGSAVQSSQSDADITKVMKVGAFGLGSHSTEIVSDVDDHTIPSGEYFAGSASLGTKPINYGFLSIHRRLASGQRVYQRWSTDGNRSWERIWVTDSWTPWAKIINILDIVGTVSEASGEPTGSLIESGTNANGSYVRYANGTQICWHVMPIPYTTATLCSSDWTFPASFSQVGSHSGTIDYGATTGNVACSINDLQGIGYTNSGANNTKWRVAARQRTGVAAFVSGNFVQARLTATGKWF